MLKVAVLLYVTWILFAKTQNVLVTRVGLPLRYCYLKWQLIKQIDAIEINRFSLPMFYSQSIHNNVKFLKKQNVFVIRCQ